MTKQDKQLLLKDLCARLPHKQKVCYKIHTSSEEITATLSGALLDYFKTEEIKVVRPYLRPMSSMTEEEREKLQNLIDEKLNYGIDSENEWSPWVLHDSTGIKNMIGGERFYFDDMSVIYDWLNAHHFDYRGLIDMGLALPAPEGMYDFNN